MELAGKMLKARVKDVSNLSPTQFSYYFPKAFFVKSASAMVRRPTPRPSSPAGVGCGPWCCVARLCDSVRCPSFLAHGVPCWAVGPTG
jgi:hypothetical protein